jgi:hypothetical protein
MIKCFARENFDWNFLEIMDKFQLDLDQVQLSNVLNSEQLLKQLDIHFLTWKVEKTFNFFMMDFFSLYF